MTQVRELLGGLQSFNLSHMPGEQPQNQYIEQAKLGDLSEQMKKLRHDPATFDEQALRQEFRERLDRVVGKKELNDRQFRMYQQALNKINDNIVKLREMRDYAVARTRMATVEKYVKAGGLPKDMPPEIRYVEYLSDYKELITFISNKPPLAIRAEDYLKDIDRARNLLQEVGWLMSAYYNEQFKEAGLQAEKKVKKQMRAGRLSLVEYMDLADAIDDLAELLRDKGQTIDKWGKSDYALEVRAEIAQRRMLAMSKLLFASRKFLDSDALAVVRRYDRALAMRVTPESKNELEQAAYARALIINREMAERNRQTAITRNADGAKFNEGEGLLAQAEKLAKVDPARAQQLYLDASRVYQEVREIYLARQTGKEKVVLQPPAQPTRRRDDRLARR